MPSQPERGDQTLVEKRSTPESFPAGTHHERDRNKTGRSRRSTPVPEQPANVLAFTKPRGLANLAGVFDPSNVPAAVKEARKLSRPQSEVMAVASRDDARTTISPAPTSRPPRQEPTPASTMKGQAAEPRWPSASAQPISSPAPWQPPAAPAPMQLPWSAFEEQAKAAKQPKATPISFVAAPMPTVQPSAPMRAPVPATPPRTTSPAPLATPAAPIAAKQTMIATPAPAPRLPPIAAPPMVAAPMVATSTVAPAPLKHADPHSLAIYEQMGLNQPSRVAKSAGKVVVSAYRLLGFGILTIIVVVLIGYIATTAFFYMSNSWIVPTAVSASDIRVVPVAAQVAEQQNRRDMLADQVADAERTIAMQQQFQAEFAKAIKSDLDGRKMALGRVRALASAAAGTRAAIASSNNAFASQSQKRMREEYQAGLIDRGAMLSGKFQLAQITSSNLSLQERQAEFETQADGLEQNAKSLDALLANANPDTALSYEVLKIKQEYEASRLDLAKSTETRDTLKASLARQDKLLEALQQTAYLRAVTDHATVAMVPYGNLAKIKKGTPLYACRLGMVICRHIGEVLTVLPGEVVFKHPHKDKDMRGQLIELKIDADESEAVEDDVLFAGGKPLLF